MLIEKLNKEQIILLIVGSEPKHYELDNVLMKKCGILTNGIFCQWNWIKDEVEKLTKKELCELYNTSYGENKNSLKNILLEIENIKIGEMLLNILNTEVKKELDLEIINKLKL